MRWHHEGVHDGDAEVLTGLLDAFNAHDLEEHRVCGDRGVSRWLLTGTTGDGEQLRVRGCDLFDPDEDGRIVRKDSYWKIVQS